MMAIIQKISILILLVYLGMGLFLYFNQKNFLYFPTENIASTYKTFTFENDGESINVIVLNEGNENAILYFGGNAESMTRSADYIARQFPHFTVYLMDYRGYGASTGKASEKVLYDDALKLYDAIKSKHKYISIGGRSLGSGIATYIAAHREVSKLVLITPYDSIANVAQALYPIYPVSWLLSEVYNSVGRVEDIDAQTLIIFAENDRIIPRPNTQKLIDAFDTKRLEVIEIKNRGHNDISSDEKYYKAVQEFIGEG